VESAPGCNILFRRALIQQLGGFDFRGVLGYGPNRDAALQFLKKILPRLHRPGCSADVMLVGAGSDDEIRFLATQDGCVILPGLVEDMMPWPAKAVVVVPAGTHLVTFSYQTPLLKAGAWASLIGPLLCIGILVRAHLQRRSTEGRA
jgi:hypothetical protein